MSVEVSGLNFNYIMKKDLTDYHPTRMRKKGSNSADALVQLLLKEGKVTAKFVEKHS